MIIPFCYVPLEADTKNYIRSTQTDVTVNGESNFQDSSFVLDGTNTIQFTVTERRQVFTKNSWAICFQVKLTEGTAGTLFKCAGYELTYAADGTVTLVTPAGSSTSAQAAISFGEAIHVALRYSNAAWSVWCNQASILDASDEFTLANPFEPVIIGPATGTIGKVCLYDRAVPYFNTMNLVDKTFWFYYFNQNNPAANEQVSEFTTDAEGKITFKGVEWAAEHFDLDGHEFISCNDNDMFLVPTESIKRIFRLDNVAGLSWDLEKQMWRVEAPGATITLPLYQHMSFRFWIDEDQGGQITENFYLGDNYAVLGDRRIIWEHDREDSNITDRLTLGDRYIRINEDTNYHALGCPQDLKLDFTGWISDIELQTAQTIEYQFPPGEVARVDVYKYRSGEVVGHYFPDAEGRCLVDKRDKEWAYAVIHYTGEFGKTKVVRKI